MKLYHNVTIARPHMAYGRPHVVPKYDFNIVVFGHTHNAMIDKDYFLVEERIYANTGSWCKDNAYCVEIDKSPRPGQPVKVNLYRVNNDGSVKRKDTETI